MRLLPQKTSFFDLFDQQVDHLCRISEELKELFRTFDNLPERHARIKDLEHQCDEITHELAREMHATFVTPLDKEDIQALASGLDDIADYIDAAGVRVVIYQIPETNPEARQLAELLVTSITVLKEAVNSLRNSKERERILPCSRRIHELENESDSIYRRALGTLFNTPGVDPILVLKWKEIYERIEMAVDKVEDVSNVLESIYLKYS